MARLRVIHKATGQSGTIDSSEFNPAIYQPAENAPQDTQATPQKGIVERVGDTAIDMGKGMLAPFAGTARNVDALTTVAAAKALEKINPQLAAQVASGKVANEQAQKIADDPGQAVKQQIADSANVASWAIPFGKGSNILTKAVIPGAVTSGIQEATQEDATAGSIAGSALVGGAGGAVLQGAGSALKLIGKGGEKAGNAAKHLGSTEVHLPADVYGATKEKAVQETLDTLGIMGAPGKQYEQLAQNMDELRSFVDTSIKGNPRPVSIPNLQSALSARLEDTMTASGISKKQAQDEITSWLADLGATSKEGVSQTPEFYDLLKKVNKQYQSAQKAIKNGTATPRHQVIAGARDVMRDALTAAYPDMPEVSQAITQEHHLMLSAPSMNRQRMTTPTMRGPLGITLPNLITNEIPNLAGRAVGTPLAAVGRGAQTAGDVIDKTGKNAGLQKAFSAFIPNLPNGTEEPQDQTGYEDASSNLNHMAGSIPQPNEQSQNTLTGHTSEELYSAYQQALASGDKASAGALRQMFEDETAYAKGQGGGKKLTEKQSSFATSAQGAQHALQLLESGKASTGLGTKELSGVGRVTGMTSKEQQDFMSTLSIARGVLLNMLAGATVPPEEYERLSNLLEIENSTTEIAKQQLRTFIREANRMSQQPVATPTVAPAY